MLTPSDVASCPRRVSSTETYPLRSGFARRSNRERAPRHEKSGDFSEPASGWIRPGKSSVVVIDVPKGEIRLNDENELKTGVPNPTPSPVPKTGGGGGKTPKPAGEWKPETPLTSTAMPLSTRPPPIVPTRPARPFE